MRYLITAIWLLIPVISGLFIYWLSGATMDRNPLLALSVGSSMVIGGAMAFVYFTESKIK